MEGVIPDHSDAGLRAGAGSVFGRLPRKFTAAPEVHSDAGLRARAGASASSSAAGCLSLTPWEEPEPPAQAEEFECQLRCGFLGNPHWHNLCSRCFYFQALLPALAAEGTAGLEGALKDLQLRGQAGEVSHNPRSNMWNRASSLRRSLFSKRSASSKNLTSGLHFQSGSRGAPLCLACITTLQIGVFLLSIVVNGGIENLETNPMIGPSVDALYLCGGLYIWQAKEYWRLISCVWLHAGIFHLLPNLALQWWAGYALERHWGARRVLEVSLCAALGGSLCSAAASARGMVTVGASGIVHGLFAARLVGSSKVSKFSNDSVAERYAWRLTALALAASLSLGAVRISDRLPRIDSWSHLGGTVAGFSASAVRLWWPTGTHYYLWLVARIAIILLGLASVGLSIYLLSCVDCYRAPGELPELLVR